MGTVLGVKLLLYHPSSSHGFGFDMLLQQRRNDCAMEIVIKYYMHILIHV